MDKKPKHHKKKTDFKRQAATKSEGRLSRPSHVNYSKGNDETEESSLDPDDATTAMPTTKTYSKRQIVTNWDKYESVLPNDDSTYNVSKATDFTSLLNAPMSEGGHFKFKSESSWESYAPSQYSNIFTVDLRKLAGGLSCISFYEQLNLSPELFGKDELNHMDAEAKQNSVQYNLSLNERTDRVVREIDDSEQVTSNLLNVSVATASSSAKHLVTKEMMSVSETLPAGLRQTDDHNVRLSMEAPSIIKETTEKCTIPILEDDDDLDFLLSLKEPVTTSSTQVVMPTEQSASIGMDDPPVCIAAVSLLTAVSSTEKTEDLEDWLDSMLDD